MEVKFIKNHANLEDTNDIKKMKNITDFITKNIDGRLSDTLKFIFNEHCDFFHDIYMDIFKFFKLKKLVEDEDNYIMSI